MYEKSRPKNMFLTDKIARKAFCVGGLFYPIIKHIFFIGHLHNLETKFEEILADGVQNRISNFDLEFRFRVTISNFNFEFRFRVSITKLYCPYRGYFVAKGCKNLT